MAFRVWKVESLPSQACNCDEDGRQKWTRQLRDRRLHSCSCQGAENISESVLEIDQRCRDLGVGWGGSWSGFLNSLTLNEFLVGGWGVEGMLYMKV